MTTFDKFRNCITEPRCRDCEGIPGVCEEEHQSVSISKALALDVLNELKEKDERIGVLTRAIKHMPRLTKLLDVYGDGYAKIVRCCDCKYQYKGCCYSRVSNRINFTVEVPDDWFCADGKRRDNDG